ncbi:MAG: hypothetical protein WBC97_09490 [Gemmatimonadales bacterium]
MTLTILAEILLAVVLAAVAIAAQAAWRRRKLLTKLRAEWGAISPTSTLDDDRVTEMWRERNDSLAPGASIDDRTWADLHLDAVLSTLDHTRTGLGRQLLYWRLRSGAAWRASPDMESLTARFGADPSLRERVGMQLSGAGRSLGYRLWVITRTDPIQLRWWYRLFPLLPLLMIGCLAAAPFEPRALIACIGLLVANVGVRTATAWQVPGLLTPIRQMGPLIRVAERLLGAVDPKGEEAGAIADDVRRLRPLRRIAWWVSRDPLVSGDIVASIWEYLNLLFLLDANAMLLSANYLKTLGPVVARVAAWVGDVDVALSVASLRAEPRAWCRPTWSDARSTQGTSVWHPLVHEPVVNDVTLREGRGTIITGANMSGKSTYLRTVGIAAILARALDTCPAASWEGRAFQVRSLIGRADDLAAGKSYYQVEADGVVEMLADSRQARPTLFLLDELLRGTNTIERLAAGEAVLKALLADGDDGNSHAVIVATHDGELVSMLAGLYAPVHFSETIGPEGLSFDYQCRPGPASTRTAIALLESTGAPKEVIEAARARAEELDSAASATGH